MPLDEHTDQITVAVVDDDAAFREVLALNLSEFGYSVVDFGDGHQLLDFLDTQSRIDLFVLDWRMPGKCGQQVLESLRGRGITAPVLVLTGLGAEEHEEAAFEFGAVDFVDKSKGLGILAQRIRVALEAGGTTLTGKQNNKYQVGFLEVDRDTSRVHWNGRQVPLTLAEFRIVDRLASRPGTDVNYRRLYDMVHGTGFQAGSGEDGYRPNVRSMIKSIRRKFHAIDPTFDAIENYPRFGYRWLHRGDTTDRA